VSALGFRVTHVDRRERVVQRLADGQAEFPWFGVRIVARPRDLSRSIW
jgi:hypothetical protein